MPAGAARMGSAVGSSGCGWVLAALGMPARPFLTDTRLTPLSAPAITTQLRRKLDALSSPHLPREALLRKLRGALGLRPEQELGRECCSFEQEGGGNSGSWLRMSKTSR